MGFARYRVWAEGGEDLRWGALGPCPRDDFCLTEAMGRGRGGWAEEESGWACRAACIYPAPGERDAFRLILGASAECQLGV